MNRRAFLRSTTALLASTTVPFARAQSPAAAPPVKMVRTDVLNVAYHEYGDASAFPVILLHGFPDDAHAYDEVGPVLATAGYRALAMYFRGYGPTRFLEAGAPRTAEQAAIAQDVVDFADALQLRRFAVAGFDWGGRAAGIVSALHPDRVRGAVLVSGYTIQNTVSRGRPASPAAARRAWYQWYFNTDAGRDGLAANRHELCELLWREWSPTWDFSKAMYERTAASFENPDFVDCVVHSYRHRNFNAPGEPRFLEMEKKLAEHPPIAVPVMTLHGADDAFGAPAPEISAQERTTLPGIVDKRIIAGAGHFVPHEKPAAFAQAVVDLLAQAK